MSPATAHTSAPDLQALRRRRQAAWACGDFAVIGATLQIVAENLVEAADVRACEQVLDVACGSGNAALAAARRFARVSAIDHVPALLERGRERARAEALPVAFHVADVEALPFANAGFDLVLSTFGVIHALDPARAAQEMQRVLKPGGRIALANWAPGGFVGGLLALVEAHVPPPPGLPSPALWGEPEHLRALFDPAPAEFHCRRRTFHFCYRSPAHFVQVFRDFHGPTHKAFAVLDADGQEALERDMTALLNAVNVAGPSSLVVPGEYLEVLIGPNPVRRPFLPSLQ